jgi:P27 family predicted phage terminase small subunit
MAGRRPKPTALKVITGNPGKRALNPDEPMPEPCKVNMPNGLSDDAKKMWRDIVPHLEVLRVLTALDRPALVRMCECYAEIQAAQEEIRNGGLIVETVTTDGKVLSRANPAVAMLSDADRRFKAYLVEFGLTPAARSKVKVAGDGDKPKEDPVRNYFG